MERVTIRLITLALAASAAFGQNSLLLGNPGCDGEGLELVNHRYLQVCYSDELRDPVWVGERLRARDLDGSAQRASNFRQDPSLNGPTAKDSDYVDSGYARGHMAPAADFTRSDEAMYASFQLSNVVPQWQAVNGGRWAQLEDAVREIVRQAGAAYVFTGPLFRANPSRIGADRVAVPAATWKVILATGKTGSKTYAYIVPNRDDADRPLEFYAVSVRAIELATGLDFFSRLPDETETEIEGEVNRLP